MGGVSISGPGLNNSTARGGTDGSGFYSIYGIRTGSVTLRYEAPGYVATDATGTITRDVTVGDIALNPFFHRTGSGDNVFDMPSTVRRVRVVGSYGGNSQNFIVRIAGRLIVNELLGSFWHTPRFEGTYVTSGGTVEITGSSGVSWEFHQEQ